jgi:anthranilate synthase component 1
MNSIRLHTRFKKLLADTFTPVSMYLQLRDVFPNSILLESSDYHGNEDSYSYIACKPLAGFVLHNGVAKQYFPDGSQEEVPVEKGRTQALAVLKAFLGRFTPVPHSSAEHAAPLKVAHNGVFGYCSYEAVEYFEDIVLHSEREQSRELPVMQYHLYQFVIALNHFTNELHIVEHTVEDANATTFSALQTTRQAHEHTIEFVESLINKKTFAQYSFRTVGEETSNFTDEEFAAALTALKQHLYRGDVFQIVPSRRFQQGFKGDDFNLYRALRSVNPSPYLFYFDYGSVRLFGSSPEAQLIIKHADAETAADGAPSGAPSGMKAEIHPIAGTFRRTGNDAEDAHRAEALKADPKENAEHVMLVDLARNDLSRHCTGVRVEVYREVQYYSHVIHLVSKVSGMLHPGVSSLDVMADTFPAGTLSGAPKYRAMELIDRYERGSRGYYAGAVGFLDFDGSINHAIMIRSFMSSNNVLTYQAGLGLVAVSDIPSEVQEVYNKLAALRRALELAQTL